MFTLRNFSKSFIRLKHDYSLKFPLQVGFPVSSDIEDTHNILSKVLIENDRSSNNIDYLVDKFSISPELFQTPKFDFIFTEQRPEQSKGLDLFLYQYKYLKYIERQGKRRFEDLKDEWRRPFDDPAYIQRSYKEKLRLWKGYQIVNFLKKYSNHSFNPYIYSNLRPWEIISDKVQKKTPPKDYELDYYDIILENASKKYRNNRLLDQYLQHYPENEMLVHEKLSPNHTQIALLSRRPKVSFYHAYNAKTGFWDRKGYQNRLLARLNRIHWFTYVSMHYIYAIGQGGEYRFDDYLNTDRTYYQGNYLEQLFYFKGNLLYRLEETEDLQV
ncbi:hypothetical protein CLIB1444_09S03312 [[Candida] jaroonii]|uniref:Uncharacterized protein n=1 Tax=[Candida] jaroonii TaxID=467808 RepID=A0ACA9YCD5_9ASCO|nr:hypothetical protein CLIB1444_09S03312 [[Candida] jaroonii]